MNTMQIIAIISPFVSAFLSAFLTYKFTSQSKRLDILYQNKVPAFKEIAANIISFKNYCDGRVAYVQGDEFHPFYKDSIGVLEHRTKIASSFETNIVFVSKHVRGRLSDLVNEMSRLCNAEISIGAGYYETRPISEYERMASLTDDVVDILYNDLNLPKK
ncbi:MAG: hypothetical protein J0I84_09175 [Terrimonas sp.]|nr:hypothetical protein [Terrimonas sp.]OJY94846.1 MAG: hypothetical protein BGP13_14350 [Sphingobacteriales bacterium 40-81]